MSTVATETTQKTQRTSLYSEHVRLGGKIVPFAGFELPIQYTSILDEHQTVRKEVGVFDITHMAQFFLTGDSPLEYLSTLVPADLSSLAEGRAVYTQLTNERGGVIDDLIIYRLPDCIMLVVNAANHQKDFNWIKSHLKPGIELRDDSEKMTKIAVQGPKAEKLLFPMAEADLTQIPFFGVVQTKLLGHPVVMARTGYTGEDGFEIFFEHAYAIEIWRAVVEGGARPCGLGARDTLRLEAGLPLYGHELNDDTTPIESSLAWTVKNKGDYLGKNIIEKQKAEGVSKKLVGLKVLGKNIPRDGFEVFFEGKKIGQVASGSIGPFVGYPIASAFLDAAQATMGKIVDIKIREKMIPAEITRVAFYRRPK